MSSPSSLVDSFGRTIRDLRISVTDRCNFRCLYCLPETEEAANFYRERFRAREAKPINYQWKPRDHFLSYEEIQRVARVFAAHGVNKIRLTGGEPLLRRNIDRLIAELAAIPGVTDIALTTNGFLFPDQAAALHHAGLRRVTFSLDSLDRQTFRKLTGRDGLDLVMKSIQTARELGFAPLKVNAVIIRHLNDHELLDLVRFAEREQVVMRFIEFMPLDSSRGWQRDHVVGKAEMLARLSSEVELTPLPGNSPSETASRWRIGNGPAEIGIIAPVTEPFCGNCNRVRLTADGQIRTCLFSLHEHDLKQTLRAGAGEEELSGQLRTIIAQKEERHHIGEHEFTQPDRTMSYIGG